MINIHLADLFPIKIVSLLGGIEKLKSYPIINNSEEIYDPISIGLYQNCPMFVLSISYKGVNYIEVFRQKHPQNNEIWLCTCKSDLFTYQEYNIFNLDQNQLNELRNISNLVKKKGTVLINNYTSELSNEEYFTDYAELY